MKLTYSRRYRRNSSRSRENKMFNKDNQHEHAFFAAPSKESFFKPNAAIQRKCAHCEAEDKQVRRMSDGKEEEKKVQKMDEKKEEKEVHKVDDKKEEKEIYKMEDPKKEEEKKVQKMDDNKEEKEVHKIEDKKEEKEIHKMDDLKKEEEKKVQKMDDKKEEKEVHKMDEKKEEKEVHKMEEKEEKKVSKKGSVAESAAPRSGAYIHSLDGKGNALPDKAKQFFSQRMGYDFSAVKIHIGTEAEQSAKDMNAKAYAVDHNIVFNKGQYNPGTSEGDKLLAHELAHIIQNKKARKISRKEQHPEKEKEKTISISGTSSNAKSKKSYGNCEGVNVQGQTDFHTLPSAFRTQISSRSSDPCDECAPSKCVTISGTIISTFRSRINVTLPSVSSGLSRCEANAVRRFINTTLRSHEQEHVTAFRTYNGTVRTPFTYTGCPDGLHDFVKSVHDSIDNQRSTDAIAQSDDLDPFVREIPCNCD